MQSCDCRPVSLHVQAGVLISHRAGVVKFQVDSPCDGLVEAVGNEVVFASNMFYVHGEGEPSLHKHCELPGLQQGTQVSDSEVEAKELSVEGAVLRHSCQLKKASGYKALFTHCSYTVSALSADQSTTCLAALPLRASKGTA